MATATASKPEQAEAPAKKGKKKLLLVAVVVLLAGAAAAYFLVLKPSSAAAATPEETAAAAKTADEAELGEVLPVDAISINLADGHYLKIGFALQKTASSTVTDGSRALDTAITLYSGKPMADLSDPAKRDALKAELVTEVKKDYDDEITDVYFTQYVMQ